MPLTTPQPQPLERILVYGNPDKIAVAPVLRTLETWCAANGVRLWIEEALGELVGAHRAKDGTWPGLGPAQNSDATQLGTPDARPIYIFGAEKDRAAAVPERAGGLIICLGGDGTLLHAVRRLWPLNGTPVLAVNLGSLSFNATAEAPDLIAGIEQWRSGAAELSERLVLEVKTKTGAQVRKASYALNDVVLAKRSEARIIHIHLRQGGDDVLGYAGDGVIISTATGSTAYNLSAGGPILYPTLRAVVATAICPHALTVRPVVLCPEPPLELKFIPHHDREDSMVYIDGQECQALSTGEVVEISAAAETLKLVQLPGMSYFERLREKMHWGGELYGPGQGEQ